jgi:hypothetical protein
LLSGAFLACLVGRIVLLGKHFQELTMYMIFKRILNILAFRENNFRTVIYVTFLPK